MFAIKYQLSYNTPKGWFTLVKWMQHPIEDVFYKSLDDCVHELEGVMKSQQVGLNEWERILENGNLKKNFKIFKKNKRYNKNPWKIGLTSRK